VAQFIDPHRLAAAEAFPAPEGDLDIERVDLHAEAARAGPLGGDERRANVMLWIVAFGVTDALVAMLPGRARPRLHRSPERSSPARVAASA